MAIELIDPASGEPVLPGGDALVASCGTRYPVVGGIPRFVDAKNYAASFGYQWQEYRTTQIDGPAVHVTSERFWKETGWAPADLDGQRVLEVGSGAGRFTDVVMRETGAELASFDYSDAVQANYANNRAHIDAGRLTLVQANIYEMPFADNYFDRAFCFGVLQHTPDFRASLEAIVRKVRPGGEIVVDFYPIKGWWTKIHAKYLLRPITRRLSDETLLRIIRATAPAMIRLYRGLSKVGLGALTRFIPVADIDGTEVANYDAAVIEEMVVLNTFDMFAPAHDHPQRIETVARWLREAGTEVTFADFVRFGASTSAVVRCRKT